MSRELTIPAGDTRLHAVDAPGGAPGLLFLSVLAALGRSARMSPDESADVVIEMDAVNGELGTDFAALECPAVFVAGTGGHPGATDEEMRTVRAAAAEAEKRSARVTVFATTPHKHTQILTKAPDTVVAAIEDVIHRGS